jgi:predicted NUDIX family NTP pyrophosphohydrolase
MLILNWSTGSEVYRHFPKCDRVPGWFAVTERGQKVTVRGTLTSVLPGMAFLRDGEYPGSPR